MNVDSFKWLIGEWNGLNVVLEGGWTGWFKNRDCWDEEDNDDEEEPMNDKRLLVACNWTDELFEELGFDIIWTTSLKLVQSGSRQ